MQIRKNFLLASLLSLLSFVVLLLPIQILANPEESTVTVSATIVNDSGPTTPILVSPGNGAYVTTNKPVFTWQESTDDSGMDHYEMSLDGSVLFSSIPLTAVDNSEYTLTYNSANGYYNLTPKTGLAQGSHTWKIRAYDTSSNGTNSATWSFTVDTQAPSFVLTAIGDQSVSISAQDLGTIPSSPVELDDNEPLLVANGEASSTVQLTVTIPGDPSQNFSGSISGAGVWGQQLGILPRDVVMTLDFVITDLAGNVSVLSGVEFIINTQVITIPPTSPSPTPSPTPSTSPSPSVTPTPGASAEITPSPSPTLPSPTPIPPLIEIPIIPPREIVNEVFQELGELTSIQTLTGAIPEEIVKVIEDTAPYSAAIVSAAIPAVTAVAVATQFGGGLSLSIFMRLLQALGLLPAGKPRGLVYNSDTYEPIPFVLLTITRVDKNLAPLVETIVSNTLGVYRSIALPPGEYKLEASHQDYIFPSNKPRPQYFRVEDFYRGEVFGITQGQEMPSFLIPMDPRSEDGAKTWKTRLRLWLAQLSKISSVLVFPMFIFSGLIAIVFPSLLNYVVFATYLAMVAYRAIAWFKIPRISGTVTDTQGVPIDHVVVRITLADTNQPIAVIMTNQDGRFQLFGEAAKYGLIVNKLGFVWLNESSVLSFYEVDTTQQNQQVSITMQPVSDLTKELFGE